MAVDVVCSRSLLFLSVICNILIAPAIAGPTLLGYSCLEKQGKYNNGSSYKANLNHLLSSLSSNTEIDKGFYNLSYGEDPDKVYAILLCRGDLKPDDCRNCLNVAIYNLTLERCPNQKEAIAWYEECMFRFSNRNISSTMEVTPEFSRGNVYNVSGDAKADFNNSLLSLLESLRDGAAAGGSLRKFALGHAAGPNFLTINALVQCTPDLSHQDCSNCLSGAFGNFWKSYGGATGGRILRPSCNFRYETYDFYDRTTDAPPLPPAPTSISCIDKGSHKTLNAIILVVPVAAFVVLATSSFASI